MCSQLCNVDQDFIANPVQALTSTLESMMLAEHLKKTGEGALADAEAIKTKSAPDDIREHPVLGTTYRLKFLELGDRGEMSTLQTQDEDQPRSPAHNPIHDDEHVDEIRSRQQEQEAHDEEAHDELSPKAKTIDDELDELFGCSYRCACICWRHGDRRAPTTPRFSELTQRFYREQVGLATIPVQQVDAEAEAAAEAAARKRTIDAIMAGKTFDEMCLVIASQPLPKRRQHFAQCCEQCAD